MMMMMMMGEMGIIKTIKNKSIRSFRFCGVS
jgi:hypothetical protein